MVLAWENLWEVFVMLVFISFLIFILLLFFICRCSSFTFSFRHHPSPFRGGFYTHFILSAQPIAEWFATLSFSAIPLSSYHERYRFKWAFFTHRCFLPYAPSQHHQGYHQGLPGSRQFFLEVCQASSDPQNTDPAHLFVWLAVIHNPLYNLDLYLYMSILQKLLLVVRTLKNITFFWFSSW